MPPPLPLLDWFTPEDLSRGAQRLAVVELSSLLELGMDWVLLFFLAFGALGAGLYGWLERRLPSLQEGPLYRVFGAEGLVGAAFLGSLALLRSLLAFPTGFYRDFVHARALGLSHETLLSYLRRMGIEVLVSVFALALLGLVIGVLRRRWPARWWLWVGGAGVVALLGDAVAEPLWSHLNFKVQVLEAGDERERIEELLRQHHTDVGEIVVIDASRYGTYANAFLSGTGPTRRLVLTDTLLAMGPEAVLGAVGHEIGHRRGERLPYRLALSCAGLLFFVYLVDKLLNLARRRGAPNDAQAMAFLLLAVSFILLILTPLHTFFARAEEREADLVELSVRRDHQSYIDSQIALTRANAAHPHPPLIIRLLHTHPSAAERIALALEFSQGVEGSQRSDGSELSDK